MIPRWPSDQLRRGSLPGGIAEALEMGMGDDGPLYIHINDMYIYIYIIYVFGYIRIYIHDIICIDTIVTP